MRLGRVVACAAAVLGVAGAVPASAQVSLRTVTCSFAGATGMIFAGAKPRVPAPLDYLGIASPVTTCRVPTAAGTELWNGSLNISNGFLPTGGNVPSVFACRAPSVNAVQISITAHGPDPGDSIESFATGALTFDGGTGFTAVGVDESGNLTRARIDLAGPLRTDCTNAYWYPSTGQAALTSVVAG